MKIRYPDLPAFFRASRHHRSIGKDPTFWRDKTLHDFPDVIHSREEFDALPERTDRLCYLSVCNQNNEHNIFESHRELTYLHDHNATPRGMQSSTTFRRAEAALNKQYQEYLELKEYIHQQRRERFQRRDERLPLVHDWVKYGQKVVPINVDAEGHVFYSYTFADNEHGTLDLTEHLSEQDVVDGTAIGCIFSYIHPRSLNNFLRILSDVNGLDLTRADIQADDLILLEPPNETEVYFVYRRLDGTLGLALSFYYELPKEVLDMFSRREIHTQRDLYDLYGSIVQIKSVIKTAPNYLTLAEDENEYHKSKVGYYHEAMLP